MADGPAGDVDDGRPQITRSGGRSTPGRVTRRDLLIGAGGLVVGAGATMLAVSQTRQDPFHMAPYDVGAVAEIERRIELDEEVVLDAQPLISIVAWNPSMPYREGTAADVYGPDGGEGHPVTSATTGLMALVLRSPQSGCRVRRCATSGWFEDPCHGSKWNGWGEWMAGPALRGLDRVPSVVEDGHLILRLSPLGLIIGPPREASVLQEPPAGPHCVDL